MSEPTPAMFSAALNSTTIFIGASITQNWPLPLHNAGIAGQTSSQILARFGPAVLGHGYGRVVVLAGTNDVLQDMKDLPGELTANLQAMGAMARKEGIVVVLCTLPPLVPNGVDRNATVMVVDRAIQQLATEQGYVLVDYFTPMYQHPEYLMADGIHPNVAGYAVMEKALTSVVTK